MVLLWAGAVFVWTAGAFYCPAGTLDTTGTGGMILGDYRAALLALSRDTAIDDTAAFEFKEGVAHFRLNDLDEAIAHFRRCDRTPSVLRPLARELIGDIEAGRNKASDAVNAYLSAKQDSTLPLQAVSAIEDKLYALVKESPMLVAPYPELAGLAAARRVLESRAPDTAAMRIDSLFARHQYALLDSVCAVSWDSMEAGMKCSIASRVAALSVTPKDLRPKDSSAAMPARGDTCFGTARLFGLSRAAYQCRKSAIAGSLLDLCEARKDFKTAIDGKQHLFLKGMISYALSKYADAAKYLSAYVKKAGPTPDAVMTLGRANRSLADDSAADAWYQRFADLYPKHPNTQDVLWYLAWEQEERKNYQKAIIQYTKICSLNKNGTRYDDALFRAALCQFKDGTYKRACSAFESFLHSQDDSPYALGALYWKAKCLSALGKQPEAVEILRSVVRLSPTDYYAFRAREILVLAGDTARLPVLDTSYDRSRTLEWLDSVSPAKKPLSAMDSIQYARGTVCALCGLVDRSSVFLDGLELRYPANLALQFDVSGLYMFVNDPVSSYKVGRRLAWRVPASARYAMPQPLMSILYPMPFWDIVSREAARNGLDPFLVLAVMRQESIFDPSIVSRAGAVGLMQLMPYTSQAVCKSLGEQFVADSLYTPGTNIRQGTFYLRQLLGQLNGNLVLAIAGYNGGPNRAAEWYSKNRRTTFDLFIEDIGFTETRGYVKKVLANYWTYRWFGAKSIEK
jgi:tetratricopeptide (TPR) repeat protein